MVVTTYDNVALAMKAFSHMTKEGASEVERREALFDILADDMVFKVAVPEDTPVYGGEFHGKQTYMDLITRDDDVIENARFDGPLDFIDGGHRVVVLGAQSYTLKKNGDTVTDQEFAVVLDFKDGKITRILNIEDCSKWLVSLLRD